LPRTEKGEKALRGTCECLVKQIRKKKITTEDGRNLPSPGEKKGEGLIRRIGPGEKKGLSQPEKTESIKGKKYRL